MSALRRIPPPKSNPGVQQLLVWIGIKKQSVYPPHDTNRILKLRRMLMMGKSRRCNFWERDEWELRDLLTEAMALYRKRIKDTHPDMPGGSNEEAVALNLAIDRLRKLFKSRGIEIGY